MLSRGKIDDYVTRVKNPTLGEPLEWKLKALAVKNSQAIKGYDVVDIPTFVLASQVSIGGLHTELVAIVDTAHEFINTENQTIVGGKKLDESRSIVLLETRYLF